MQDIYDLDTFVETTTPPDDDCCYAVFLGLFIPDDESNLDDNPDNLDNCIFAMKGIVTDIESARLKTINAEGCSLTCLAYCLPQLTDGIMYCFKKAPCVNFKVYVIPSDSEEKFRHVYSIDIIEALTFKNIQTYQNRTTNELYPIRYFVPPNQL